MDRHLQTRVPDLETVRLEALELLLQLLQQAQVSADQQAEARESDFKVLQLVLEDRVSLDAVDLLVSLQASHLLVSLLLALVDLPVALPALHLPLAAVDSRLGDRI
jgi:hypothetical protein